MIQEGADGGLALLLDITSDRVTILGEDAVMVYPGY